MIGIIAIDRPVRAFAVELSARAEDEDVSALTGGAGKIRIEAAASRTGRRRRGCVFRPMKRFKSPELSGWRSGLRSENFPMRRRGRLDNCHRRSWRKRLVCTNRIQNANRRYYPKHDFARHGSSSQPDSLGNLQRLSTSQGMPLQSVSQFKGACLFLSRLCQAGSQRILIEYLFEQTSVFILHAAMRAGLHFGDSTHRHV
jgi:hypothetical protein